MKRQAFAMRRVGVLVVAVLVLLGGEVAGAQTAATQPVASPGLEAWGRRPHPRLMLEAGRVEAGADGLAAGQKDLWRQAAREIERLKGVRAPRNGRLDRGHGNMLARLAVMARLSQDAELLETARRYLLDTCARGVVDADDDLVRGHFLWGGAIAYDWLHSDLSDAERKVVREKLAQEAQRHGEATVAERGYWRNQYLQNHGHVNMGGLAFAAAALAGEDDRAAEWMRLADEFFAETFRWSNPDGTSIEGLSYGMYALEFCLRYAELARQVRGVDYFQDPWFANAPLYVLHSSLPVMTDDEWAMTFGDSPRAANSHLPTHSLAKIAAEREDPVAQGAGAMLRELHGTPGRDAWQTVLWYDAAVPATARNSLPTFHHFADTGQVMMRTDWSADATMVGLHCGPWLGHNAWGRAKWDLGAAHAHPDINSFQLFAEGEWLLIDPGYTYRKRTSDHSTLLVDGQGQLGGDVTWFGAEDASAYDHFARIARTESNEQYDYVMGDGTHAYHPGLGLRHFVRHWLLLKPTGTVVIVDDIAAAPTGFHKAWTRESVQFEGMKVEDPKREFLVPAGEDRKGRVWFTYDGPCGTFDVDVDYFDNWPGTGRYVLSVAGKVAAEWAHDVQHTDLHTRTVRGVKIHEGDTVELRGEPFGKPGKFIKIAVSNRSALRGEPHKVQLLLHAPFEAKVQPAEVRGQDTVRYAVEAGKAALDVWASGTGLSARSEPYEVVQGSQIRRTQRIVFEPKLAWGEHEHTAVLVTVLQPRKADARAGRMRIDATHDQADRSVSLRIEDAAGTWAGKVHLEDGQVRMERSTER